MATEFVQLGDFVFQPAKVHSVYFDDNGDIWISFGRTTGKGDMCFAGLSALAFKEWWEKKANVYYVDPKWFDKDHPSNWEDEENREVK